MYVFNQLMRNLSQWSDFIIKMNTDEFLTLIEKRGGNGSLHFDIENVRRPFECLPDGSDVPSTPLGKLSTRTIALRPQPYFCSKVSR